MENNRIAIIGAGIMGQGVSFQLAKFGYEVTLIDVEQEILANALANIRNIGRLDVIMQAQKRSPERPTDHVLSRIHCSTNLAAVAGAAVIVENVPEKIDIKLHVYERLRELVSNETLVAINTSATPITKLAARLPNPAAVLGIHFVNPVHLMPTVEIVRGLFTSDATLARAKALLATMQMKGVVVQDAPGFVSNRIMLTYINEAIFCVQERVGTAKDVDQIFRECLAHTMGPLETADLIGLDTILYSLEVLHSEFSDSKYRPAYLLKQLVDSGQLGKKSGQGFYSYSD